MTKRAPIHSQQKLWPWNARLPCIITSENNPNHAQITESFKIFHSNRRYHILLSTVGGTSQQVLEFPNERIDYVNSICFKDLLHFIARHNIKIITRKYMSIEIQRRNDKCIKDEVLQSNLNKSKIILVNECRLYLHIIYLSAIIEPDGKTVNPMYYTGKRSSYSTSKFKWPHQSKPSNVAWKTWHKTIQKILHIPKNGILPPNHTLHQWLITTKNRYMAYEWYHDTKSEELFRNKDTEIYQYFSKETTYHTLHFNVDSRITTNIIPSSATITKKSNNNFHCYPQHDITIVPTKISMSFKRHLNNLPDWKNIIIQSGKEINANESLLELIQTKQNIIIASDGSKLATTSGGA